MTIFELIILKCVTMSALSGSYSKTCEWLSTGDLYGSAERCGIEAGKRIGNIVFGNVLYSNGDGRISSEAVIENSNCTQRIVNEGMSD